MAGNENGVGASPHTAVSSSSLISQRWVYLLILSLGVVYIAYEIAMKSNVALESSRGILHLYEPLVGKKGVIYSELDTGDKSFLYEVNEGLDDDDDIFNEGDGEDDFIISTDNTHRSDDAHFADNEERVHPRITCFTMEIDDDSDDDDTPCLMETEPSELTLPSIPQQESRSKYSGKSYSSSSDTVDVRGEETDECQLSDPSYQTKLAAPSTCNDVHSLAFRFGPSKNEPLWGVNNAYPSRHEIKYLTSGGFRSVWTVKQLLYNADEEEDKVIMKTNRLSRGWSAYYMDQNRRDILISERAGKSPILIEESISTTIPQRQQGMTHSSNVLPVYQYCAFSSVTPFATAGTLDDYIWDRREDGNLFTAEEQYILAMQAARGLYQAQLFKDREATHVHADVKPPQFLLFDRPSASAGGTDVKKNATQQNHIDVPIMQLNDFNRGKFLTRDTKTDATCPFTMCHVHHKGSLYRSPEEYMECANQTDRIDVFSLGGVFFYILSDGKKPWYNGGSYKKSVAKILNGEQPTLPTIEEYNTREFDKKVVAFVRERSKHPAFTALKKVMSKCWEFEPEDRPSALRVVEMLEEEWERMYPSTADAKEGGSGGWTSWINKLRAGGRRKMTGEQRKPLAI